MSDRVSQRITIVAMPGDLLFSGIGFRCAVVLACAILFPAGVLAQGTSMGGLRANDINRSPSSPAEDLQSQLDQLRRATSHIREQINSSTDANESFRAPQHRSQSSGVTTSLADLPASSDTAKGANDIRHRIELLRRLRKRAAGQDKDGRRLMTSTEQLPRQPSTPQPTLSSIEENLKPTAKPSKRSTSAVPATTEATMTATKILSTPVSHLQLGQSLYQTKNYASALKALEQVDAAALSDSDRSWLELLIALCQRRLGDTDAAETRLREIANAKSTDYPILSARWWLKQSELTRDAQSVIEESTPEIHSLMERAKTHAEF